MKIEGSIAALITPMKSNGDIDWQTFDFLIDWHLAEGTNAVLVASIAGESATLTAFEHHALVERAAARINGRIPVIAGIDTNCTRTAIRSVREAKLLGADAVHAVTPYYNKPMQRGIYLHFMSMADAADIPLILHNAPMLTRCDMSNETIRQLSTHKNIVGINDASGDIKRGIELIDTCEKHFSIFSGLDHSAFELTLKGGRGVFSMIANVIPRSMSQLCADALQGNIENARALNQQLQPLFEQLLSELSPVAVKWALFEMGRICNGIRLPLLPLAPHLQRGVQTALRHFICDPRTDYLYRTRY